MTWKIFKERTIISRVSYILIVIFNLLLWGAWLTDTSLLPISIVITVSVIGSLAMKPICSAVWITLRIMYSSLRGLIRYGANITSGKAKPINPELKGAGKIFFNATLISIVSATLLGIFSRLDNGFLNFSLSAISTLSFTLSFVCALIAGVTFIVLLIHRLTFAIIHKLDRHDDAISPK